MNRYTVTMNPERTAWGIIDRIQWGYCALPYEDGEEPEILLWRSFEEAVTWLDFCYHRWAADKASAPKGWRPMAPDIAQLVRTYP
ncbi:hypothetical protein ACFY9R_26455 [Streptomyces albidoflavus]|uniref:hypothetical protein n=1 Tax=Streptomyces albidoflavus TaxID=1886 RepID=UPI0033F3CBE1